VNREAGSEEKPKPQRKPRQTPKRAREPETDSDEPVSGDKGRPRKAKNRLVKSSSSKEEKKGESTVPMSTEEEQSGGL